MGTLGGMALWMALNVMQQPGPAAPAEQPTLAPAVGEAQTLDVQLRRLSDALASGLQAKGDPRARRFAVLPFTETGSGARDAQLGTVVGEQLAGLLRRDHRFTVLERARLKDVLGEQALQQSGLVAPEKVSQMGVMLDADALVVGQVASLGKVYRITARVVDASDATVLVDTQVDVPTEALTALSRNAVVLRSKSDAAFRSALLPGWGQAYNRQPIKSVVFVGLALGVAAFVAAAVGVGVLGAGYYLTCNADCVEGRGRPIPGTNARLSFLNFTTLRIITAQAVLVTLALLAVAGVTWGINVVDAYLSGVDG